MDVWSPFFGMGDEESMAGVGFWKIMGRSTHLVYG
jgi:hypothetical protein